MKFLKNRKIRISNLFLSLLLITIASNHAFSQCGVQADISINSGLYTSGMGVFDNSITQPNWVIYNYEWKENNIVLSNSKYFYDYSKYSLLDGINRLCLTVWATDTLTGDSCESKICDIYHNTFHGSSVNLHVQSANGLTVNFEIQYLNRFTDFSSTNTYVVDYGDGSPLPVNPMNATASFSHTFPAAGNYNVYYNADGGGSAYGNRTIAVDNGITNLESLNSPFYSINTCNSTLLNLQSYPPFASSYYYFWGPPDAGTILGSGAYNTSLSTQFVLPGHYFAFIDYSGPPSAYEHISFLVGTDCINPPDTIYGKAWHDQNLNGIIDSGETGIPNAVITVFNYNTTSDSSGNYSIIVPHVSTSLNASCAGFIKTFPQNPYVFSYLNGTGHYNFNFGFSIPYPFCGKVFLDYNADSIFTTNIDQGIGAATIKLNDSITGTFYTTTNVSGDYCILIPTGNYTVTVLHVPIDSALTVPDTILVNHSIAGTNNQNFIITSGFAGGNFNLFMNTNRNPRPGMGFYLQTRVANSGIDSLTGTLTVSYDSILTVSTLIPASGIVDTANHTISWNTGYLKSAAEKVFKAEMIVPASTSLGTPLFFSASIDAIPASADHDSSNNVTAFTTIVVSGFDPNDKSVIPAGNGISGEIHHETTLNYRINFQNTGTASTFNIVVQDTLSSNLDLSTFQMHQASHPYSLIINGNTLAWKFSNINLPDSNTNEPLSHGFIEYSIQPLQGLPDGTTIENNAQIYFDFNEPVTTNTTLNTLQTLITEVNYEHPEKQILFYPNPFRNDIHVYIPAPFKEDVIFELSDVSGKTLYSSIISANTNYKAIHIDNLSANVIIAKLKSNKFVLTKKLISLGR